jgi:hypothetical protein
MSIFYLETQKIIIMDVYYATTLADRRLVESGLRDWKFYVNECRGRVVCLLAPQKTIEVSLSMIDGQTTDVVEQMIDGLVQRAAARQ